ncbi:MAG: hypothetical protein WCT23_10295 [Candidatus Neomarinimicrobiota bacterium]
MAYTDHLSEQDKEDIKKLIRDYELILSGDLTEMDQEIKDKKNDPER